MRYPRLTVGHCKISLFFALACQARNKIHKPAGPLRLIGLFNLATYETSIKRNIRKERCNTASSEATPSVHITIPPPETPTRDPIKLYKATAEF